MNNEKTNLEVLVLSGISILFIALSAIFNVPTAIIVSSLVCAVLGFILIKKRWQKLIKVPVIYGYIMIALSIFVFIYLTVWAW